MSDKNTGIPYERFTKDIFDELHRVEGVEHIEIKHNVRLEGKSTNHQIDVYWSFKQGGVTHHVVVQAKDWGSPVTQEKVLAFRGVLNDLKIGATGIMVTRTGYQEGAEAVARNNGILLYRLAEMSEEDWEGRTKTLTVSLQVAVPNMTFFEPVVDQNWLSQERDRLGIPKDQEVPVQISNESKIVDSKGQLLCTVADVIKAGEDDARTKTGETAYSHPLGEDAFIETGESKLPLIKATELRLRFKVLEMNQDIVTEGSDLVSFILANVTDGTTHLFGPDKRHFGTTEAEGNPATTQ